MRNLALLSVDDNQTGIPEPARFLVVDVLSNTAFFSTSNEVFSYSLEERKITNSVKVGATEGIASIDYLVDDELLSVGTSNGDIFEWKYAEGSFECVGTMDSGISCMSWSPDQEILVLATGDDKIVLMSRELDPIFETDLNPAEFGEAQLITVGWGKKETQFHGAEGKPTGKDLEAKTADPVLPWDDGRVRISWCEDGQSFAISSVDRQTGARKIRVRTSDGTLFSTSEVVNGLEHALNWKPNGTLIASSQRKPNKHDIIFFEKNGLKHGEFSLPFQVKDVQVIELCWNKTSEVLAIWLENLDHVTDVSKQKPLSCIQLWTRSNYHWYLKQELRFSLLDLQISCMMWDVEIPLKLHVVCTGGDYYQFNWRWTVSKSEDSCVAVIDGANLLLTPFAKSVVPPPMSLKKLVLPSPINQVCFGITSNVLTVALSDGTIQSLNTSDDSSAADTIQVIFENKNEATSLSKGFGFLHLTRWSENSYLGVGLTVENMDAVCHLTAEKNEDSRIAVRNVLPQNEKVYSIAVGSDSSCVAMQMQNGDIYTCDKDEDAVTVKPWITPSGHALRLPHLCESISVCKVNHEDFLIGRTSRFILYINEKQIADNCTSFAIHEEFLVYTSHDHTLHCLLLSKLLNYLHSDEKVDLNANERKRRLERGSRIVSVVSQDTKVVLQMPRGNLETIHPRALVVSFLKRLLDRLAYREALTTMKRHRINLNLIYDHNPKLFLDNVEKFMTNIASEGDINLFLADLVENDVTRTLYGTSYDETTLELRAAEQLSACGASTKIDTVCLAVRDVILKTGTQRLFLSFLTSYVKQTSPDLERVLIEIKKLKDNVTNADVTYEKALKHILYITDVNGLYNVALGLYDFDIILMIAEKSNKDPKEYLPFLNHLRSYDEDYRKFKIDCHLKRYEKAMKHLYACGKPRAAEFLQFVAANGLYKESLKLCMDDREHFKNISFLYASDLAKKAVHLEAGLVFSRAGFHEEALAAYVNCLSWKLALCEAGKLQYSKEQLSQLARNIADQFKEKERWSEASFLYEIYVQDFESAITSSLDGYLWEDALRLIYRCGRLDLIETNFITAILDAYRHYCEVIEDFRTRYTKYKERLVVVRELKEKQSAELLESGRDEIENDLFSEASSMTGQSTSSRSSKGSRSSGHSSKSRRKIHRKKYSLKEGSKFEDFALLDAICNIVNAADKLQENVASILEVLITFSRQKEATTLQNSFNKCLSSIETTINEIWSYESDSVAKQLATGPHATVNSMLADLQLNKQNVSQSSVDDLPELKKPILRKNISWRLLQLS